MIAFRRCNIKTECRRACEPAARKTAAALPQTDEGFAKPDMPAWSNEQALRLIERKPDKNEDDPKALACYGVYFPEQKQQQNMLLRFVKGRPVSSVTCEFLQWACQRLAEQGKRGWALVWDRASWHTTSWHTSYETQDWITSYNQITSHKQKVKQTGEGVRILSCLLPSKSPWLNPIEPKWLHGKRAIVKPDGVLTVKEVIERVHTHYDCDLLEPIAQETG